MACHTVDVGLRYEQFLFRRAQAAPIPIGDGVVEMVGVGAEKDAVLAYLCLAAGLRIVVVGLEVLLHVLQLQHTVGGGRDGQRQVDGLGVS